MPLELRDPSLDLLLPLPSGEDLHPQTLHTYYFGFSVPEEQIYVFCHLRALPAFPLSQGGVCIVQGLDNPSPLDIEHLEFQTAMPWPELDGQTIRMANGLSFEFIEPGETVRLRYRGENGQVSFDVLMEATTPLFARSFVMPGEEDFHASRARSHGGLEQYMRCTGELTLFGKRHDVDCYHLRDRSLNQIRVQDTANRPPTAWTPMRFGDDLTLNLTCAESASTDPVWAGIYEPKDEAGCILSGWVYAAGEKSARAITWARRKVLDRDPDLLVATRQELEVRDEDGNSYRFDGEAIAAAPTPQWPNLGYGVTLYRWSDDRGRQCHSDFQELWYAPFQRLMRQRQAKSA